MRVALSGVWRRAFVRSCVSLRNRGCSKLSVVPHIVWFRWHVMLFYRAGKVTASEITAHSRTLCLLNSFLSSLSLSLDRTCNHVPFFFVSAYHYDVAYRHIYLQQAVRKVFMRVRRDTSVDSPHVNHHEHLILMYVRRTTISVTLLSYYKYFGNILALGISPSYMRIAWTTGIFLKVRISLISARSTSASSVRVTEARRQ